MLECTPLPFSTHTWTTKSCGAIFSKVGELSLRSDSGRQLIIRIAAWEVENGQSTLTVQNAPPELAELQAEAREYYDKEMIQYQQKTRTDPATDPNEGQAASQQTPAPLVPAQQALFDAPIAPNNLVPYKGNQFGLDAARRDCRFEMIKIVREVILCKFRVTPSLFCVVIGRCRSLRPQSCVRSVANLAVSQSHCIPHAAPCNDMISPPCTFFCRPIYRL
jgi:hypothetical protein